MKPKFSLSTKIVLVASLNFALLLAVFAVFAKAQFRMNLGSFVLAPVQDRILSVSRLIALNLPENRPDSWTALLERYSSVYPSDFYLFGNDGVQLAGKPLSVPPEIAAWIKNDHNPFFDDPKAARSRSREGAKGGRETPQFPLYLTKAGSPPVYWAGVRIPVRNAALRHPMHGSIIWVFPSLWTNPFFFDYKPYLAVICAVMLVSVACWLPLIRSLTRAIYQLTSATGRIAEGQFEIELPENRRDELGQLSESVHRMAGSLSDFVHGQKRFLSDIAHELSAPIARIQVALGILEQRADDKQREYVADLREEVQQMSSLVNEILSFSKAEMGGGVSTNEAVNVARTLELVLQRESMPHASFVVDVAPDLEVSANRDYLFRALANLVRNAVRYAADAGPIMISGKREGPNVWVTVSDHGPGIPEAELERVFKPFYRPEFARLRDTGGVGLGLAIVKSCIEACGGAVRCRNKLPKGLSVEIRLNAADAAADQAPASLQDSVAS